MFSSLSMALHFAYVMVRQAKKNNCFPDGSVIKAFKERNLPGKDAWTTDTLAVAVRSICQVATLLRVGHEAYT